MKNQDEALGHSRRKKWILLGITLGVLLLGLPLGIFLGIKSFVEKSPAYLQSALEKEGITLSYSSTSKTKSWIGFQINDLEISGADLPVSGKAQNLSLQLGFAPRLKPLKLEIRLTNSEFIKNAKAVSAAKPTTKKAPPSFGAKLAGFGVRFLDTKTVIENLSAPSYGIEHLHYNFDVGSLSISREGTPSVTAYHKLRIEKVTDYPKLNGLEMEGQIHLQPPTINLSKHTGAVGPLSILFDSTVDIESQKWSLRSEIPKTDLTQRPKGLSRMALEYMKPKGGTLSLKLDLSGEGADVAKIKGEGNFELEDFKGKLNHPYLEGIAVGTIKTQFKKDPELVVSADASIDLNGLMFRYENYFYKEQGVPCNLDLHFTGNEKRIQVKPSKLVFHSLNSSFSGDFPLNPKETASFQFKVDPTDMTRWERFFPKQMNIRTYGSVAASGNFSGSIENWQTGKLTLDIAAQNFQFPLLPEWTTGKNVSLAGNLNVDSKTHIELDNGAMKSLGTDSQISLTSVDVKYGNLFEKKAGTLLALDLVVKSNATQAEIKKGLFELDKIKVKAAGKIQNFKNPNASLTIESSPIALNQILSFSPSIQPKNISQMAGVIALKSKVSGLLLSPKGPRVDGTLDVKNLSLGYELESKKKIALQKLSGPIQFTNETLQAKNIAFSFPRSQGIASFQIRDFKNPNVQFNLNASRFTLADFYDLPKGSNVPPGAVPVPLASGKAADFREDPFLKELKVSGGIQVQQADLGYTSVSPLSAQVEFKNMKLTVSPLKMGAYGGTIVSYTEWDGNPSVPTTKQKLQVTNVDANQFLSSYSEKSKNLMEGRFSAEMELNFAGMDADQIKKTLEGAGTFTLKEGRVKTVRLTKDPLESLKKVPLLGNNISKTEWDEKINDATGKFALKNGQLSLSNVSIHSPYFDALASQVAVDMNQNLTASVLWTPKNNLFSGDAYEMLKDDQGKTSIPLTVSGSVMSPSIGVETSALESRARNHISRRLAAEKDRAIQEAKRQAENEAKKKIQETLKGKIDQGLGNLFQ